MPAAAPRRRARALTAIALGLAVALATPAFAAMAPLRVKPAPAFPEIAILCYHDLSPDTTQPLQTVPEEFLREQIAACRERGWAFLSLADVLAKRDHPESLPPRVMVLTFDDGYRSFTTRALPLLREAGVPSLLAVITSFVDRPPPDVPPLMSWNEIRAAEAAGVAIASHSHELHRYETSNPYRDTAPSVATRRWRGGDGRYEDREEYRGRLRADMVATQAALREHLGHAATALVWPYGMHDEMARGQAALAGFEVTLALGSRLVTAADLATGCLPRILVTRNLRFGDSTEAWRRAVPAPARMAQVDLGAIWDADEARFRARLDDVVARVRALGATQVVLPAFPAPSADGRLVHAWAMNHQVPVLADVWSMAAAQFAAAHLRVWVRSPSMNLSWAWDRHPEWRLRGETRGAPSRWRTRLSPDVPGALQAAEDFLTDLAVYLPIDGVLFDDDATIRPGERMALDPAAGPARERAAIRAWIEGCKQAVRAWRPECRFGRVLPAEVAERAGIDARYAMDFGECVASDDVVVLEPGAGPRASTPAAIGRLARAAAARSRPAGAEVVLLLPAYDPAAGGWLPAATQQAMADAARRAGRVRLGLAPVAAEGPLPIGLLEDAALPRSDRSAGAH